MNHLIIISIYIQSISRELDPTPHNHIEIKCGTHLKLVIQFLKDLQHHQSHSNSLFPRIYHTTFTIYL